MSVPGVFRVALRMQVRDAFDPREAIFGGTRYLRVRIRFAHCRLDNRMRRSQRTCRIRYHVVTRKQERLATASAEIFRAPLATAARLRHPVFAAKTLE